jgi:hypothetical protein
MAWKKCFNRIRGKLHITGLFTLRRPLGGSGSGFARSIASLIPTQNLRHILSALEMLRVSLFGPPKRRKQPERYVPFLDKILLKNN